MLKFWRDIFSLSQEDLAQYLDCSPRHVSRMENGHVHPSMALVQKIAEVLSLGDRDSNQLLIAAGYASRPLSIDFYASELQWLRTAMRKTLGALEPYPTVLLGNSVDILMVNKAWAALFQQLMSLEKLESYSTYYEFLYDIAVPGTQPENYKNMLSLMLLSLHQRHIMYNEHEAKASLDKLTKHAQVPSDWKARASRLEPRASYPVQINLNNKVRNFLSVSQTVGPIGPSAYVSEPRLVITTLHPMDEDFVLPELVDASPGYTKLY